MTTTSLPRHAHIWPRVAPGDFLDTYSIATPLSARQALELALRSPNWAQSLLRLRDALVRPLGLKTASSNGQLGFPVEYETEEEVLIGMDDRHLDFRITVLKQDGIVHIATWVHRNNALGRVYLALVMPFHKLILQSAVKRIAAAG
ncbi:DUF2867 domain-containing protein [Pseudodonghicola xiamenensis]|uniref:DUF2867 domain-containing protein n=1 Tax=Pseudodonghicola xiamenensis TaxID=337702 RepID=A0A8J3H8U9_9RHOB|nr:DUF2867 domain-containing protein [Pseudodonghicola xiamenensis]GHH00016.1 hypothetical protein GCM10010961_36400 [Pseudodonghicola xiamenensis]